MNIYHLDVKDQDDHQFDIDYHFSHPTKGATQLWEDYHEVYNKIIDNEKDWTIVSIIDGLEKMGWEKVNIQTVDVYY